MAKLFRSSFTQALINEKILDKEKVDELEKQAAAAGKKFDDLLLEQGLISEEEMAKVKSKAFDMPFISLFEGEIPDDVINIIPQTVAENYKLVVFDKKKDEIKVAMVDPLDYRALEAVEFLVKKQKLKVKYYITTFSGFRNAAKKYRVFGEEVSQALEVLEEKKVENKKTVNQSKVEDVVEVIKRAPVAQIVSVIIKQAIDMGASDIHIEPADKESRVRYRIDGVLKTNLTLPEYLHSSVVSRIKVLANLKIDETRVPQDGRIRMSFEGKDADMRISTLPLMGTEKVAIRILPTSNQILSLEQLGFQKGVLEILKKTVERPVGVLLISGPTGSGKSTTLYAMLNILNRENVNIITLEDPVEYSLPGINQSQVNPEIGMTFSSGLRAILRQDPNIVMVGEIRDNETAELAVHAALTGHFMLSTIHAKDAAGVIPRLIDMKVEPFLISSSLNLIIAQRLVRKICENCKEVADIPQDVIDEMDKEVKLINPINFTAIPKSSKLVFYKGKGCARCNNSGYKGRMVAAEVLVMNESLRDITTGVINIDLINKELKNQGLPNMKQDALLKALAGETTVEEVIRISRE